MLSNADRALQKILIYRHSSVDLGDELVGLTGAYANFSSYLKANSLRRKKYGSC